MSQPRTQVSRGWLALLALMLLFTSLGCSVGRMIFGDPTPTPTLPPPTLRPTWTPLPPGQLSPAEIATLTVIAGVTFPTLTPTWTPIATPTPRPTPTLAEPTPTIEVPTPTPLPQVVIQGQVVNVRQGPSIAYAIIGQVRVGETYDLVGRNDLATWWLICCVNGQQGWVTAQLVSPQGNIDGLPIIAPPELPPTPVPVDTPGPTDTPRPYRPFDIGDGPQFFTSNNAWLTVWVKAFTGRPPIFLPVPGYRLRVLRNGMDVSKPGLTKNVFELSAPLDPNNPDLFGARREYNLKYEYLPEAGDASWEIYLIDQNGIQVSPAVTFQTERTGSLREVYVGFFDTR